MGAKTQILSEDIKNGEVKTDDIKDSAVTADKILNSAVTTDKINDDAVITQKILNSAITDSKLNKGSVTRPKLSELRPHQNTPADNKVYVEPGRILKSDGSGTMDFAGGNSPVFNPVIGSGNSRIDLLCLKDDATLYIQEGVEVLSPLIPTYPTDKRVITETIINETGTAVINDADIKDVRGFGGGGGGAGGVAITPRRFIYTATGGETVMNFPFAFTVGNGSLMVFRGDGLLQQINVDYTETDENTITLTVALVNGEVLQAVVVPGGGTTRVMTVFTNLSSIVYNHNLGIYPIVLIIDTTASPYEQILPDSLQFNSLNQITIGFSSNKTGIIICIAGSAGRSDIVGQYIATSGLNIYDTVYKNSTADQIDHANASSESTMPAIGICVSIPVNGQLTDILKIGLVSNPNWSWTAGDKIYVGTTAGGLTNTAPVGAGKIVQIIGIAKSSNVIDCNFGLFYAILS